MTQLAPFVVLPALSAAPDRADPPAGLRRFDPLRVASAAFVNRLKRLEAAIHAAWDQIAPDWVFYDCALVPGGVFGLALAASSVPPHIRRLLDPDADDDALLPVAMLIAIPTACPEPRVDLVHTVGFVEATPDGLPPGWLCEAACRDPEALVAELWRGAAQALDFDAALVTAPWREPTLRQLVRLGPLRVFHAWNPAHDDPRSATLGLSLRAASQEPDAATDALALACDEGLKQLQSHLDGGGEAWLTGVAPGPGALGGVWRLRHGATGAGAGPLAAVRRTP
jgi:hypothetical protein